MPFRPQAVAHHSQVDDGEVDDSDDDDFDDHDDADEGLDNDKDDDAHYDDDDVPSDHRRIRKYRHDEHSILWCDIASPASLMKRRDATSLPEDPMR